MFGTTQQNGSAQNSSDLIKETTTAEFRRDVLEESLKQPVIVDFWSPSCGPCKQLTPVLEKIIKEQKGKIKLVKLNTEQYPQIPQQLRIQSVPTIFAFVEGQPVDGFVGNLPESQIKAFVERIVKTSTGDPMEEILAEADRRIHEGDLGGASELYAHVLAHEPGHTGAIAALVTLHLKLKDIEGAKGFLAMVPADKAKDPAIVAARSAIELAEQADSLGDVSELQKRISADPSDFQACLDLAIAFNASGKRAEATDLLIEIMRKDRSWNDDAARKQLLQFFEVWGPMDPSVKEGRRKLSSLLFS